MTTPAWIAMGAVLLVPGLLLVILSFALAATAAAEDKYATAPPCAAGTQGVGNCRANLVATVMATTHVAPSACNTASRYGAGACWSLTFRLAGGSVVTQNFDFIDYSGATSRPPVDAPASGTVEIWSNRLVSFTWNGNVFPSTAYPLGSGETTALRYVGIGSVLLGSLCVALGIRRHSRSRITAG